MLYVFIEFIFGFFKRVGYFQRGFHYYCMSNIRDRDVEIALIWFYLNIFLSLFRIFLLRKLNQYHPYLQSFFFSKLCCYLSHNTKRNNIFYTLLEYKFSFALWLSEESRYIEEFHCFSWRYLWLLIPLLIVA